ncbi:MAG: Histidine kinase [uncultured Sulfurovum sp.]|uniref:histidine kinase n=1 Tax=uncultured Sulfurovum sp. TaxID=269237 RepID=A0A6S6SII4_9BACT|nr:MAG: Histidine kinase [uncultured Sulfurovum sp.]
MNRHALRLQISLFFVFLLLSINTLFFVQHQLESKQLKQEMVDRFHESMRVLEMGHREHLPFEGIRNTLYIMTKMQLLEEPKIVDINRATSLVNDKDLKIYRQDGYLYYLHKNPHGEEGIGFAYKEKAYESINTTLFALLMNVFVFLFYLYVMRKLQPLQRLKSKIVRFSEGELEVSEAQKGKDEIAEVSNEFNNAIAKIKTLQDSRNLFLRNIMHELKTPIAKGKLITDLMDDTKNQERLQRIFSRFEYLLGEFTKIEQVTSNAMILDKKHFRVIDILDNAFDILLIESSAVEMEIKESLEIEADYELMSTAFKNLIDNALKYGTKPVKIIIDKSTVTIESKGDKLKNSSFETAFNRAFEDSSKGLGLGLYITHHIVKKHGFELKYEWIDGVNRFRVCC